MRTIKNVLISIPPAGKYIRWVYRVVECEVGQHGYLNERAVRVIAESRPLYRPTTKSGRGVGPETKQRFDRIAQDALLAALGV